MNWGSTIQSSAPVSIRSDSACVVESARMSRRCAIVSSGQWPCRSLLRAPSLLKRPSPGYVPNPTLSRLFLALQAGLTSAPRNNWLRNTGTKMLETPSHRPRGFYAVTIMTHAQYNRAFQCQDCQCEGVSSILVPVFLNQLFRGADVRPA